jgi:hypothetical protein
MKMKEGWKEERKEDYSIPSFLHLPSFLPSSYPLLPSSSFVFLPSFHPSRKSRWAHSWEEGRKEGGKEDEGRKVKEGRKMKEGWKMKDGR